MRGSTAVSWVGVVVLAAALAPTSLGQLASPVSPATVPCPGIIALSPETMSLDPPPHVLCPGISTGTFLGGSREDWAVGIAVDSLGFRYTTGFTYSADFLVTPEAYDASFGGTTPDDADGFVAKFNPDGALVYSTFLGGSSWDEGWSIAMDISGNAYVMGNTISSDFPTTNTAAFPHYAGSSDVFVTKLDRGGQVVYSTFLGGWGEDGGWDIAVDAAGSAYVTGYTLSRDFPATSRKYAKAGEPWQAFVTKLNPEGSAIVYSTLIGGSGAETAEGIAVDSEGNVFLTGATSSPDFPITKEGVEFGGGSHDDFVLKLDPSGEMLVFSTFLGGSDYEDANGIALDGQGNVYIAGFTRSWDFPTTNGAFDRVLDGVADAYVVKLNETGDFAYSTLLGGEQYDDTWAIAVDEAGHAYVTGETYSDGFPTTKGALDATHNSDRDAYIVKLDPSGTGLVYSSFLGGAVEQPDSEAGDLGTSVAIDATGNATVVGGTSAPDFPVLEDAADTTYNGIVDAFLVTLQLVPEPNRPPVAWFEVTQSSTNPTHLFVDARRSADAEDVDDLLVVRWDWEDDGVWDTDWSSTMTASHTYVSPGTFIIRLEVRDAEGLTGNTTRQVTIPGNRAPTLTTINSVPAVAIAGEDVQLSASASDPEGDVLTYAWDFGDGASDTGTTLAGGGTITATHTYAAEGMYTVTLVVTDGKGGSASGSVSVSVSPPPNVAPSLTPVSMSWTVVVVGQEVVLMSTASDPDGDPVAWTIDWGDGTQSSGSTPAGGGAILAARSYLMPGAHTITLTVTDGRGGSTSETASVTVTARPPEPSGGSEPVVLWAIGGVMVAIATGFGFLIWRVFRRSRN